MWRGRPMGDTTRDASHYSYQLDGTRGLPDAYIENAMSVDAAG